MSDPILTGDFVPQPTSGFTFTAGDTIGPYKLRQQLGQGGMGEVWVAEQSEPVRRQVAIKLIKVGMDSAQVIARFNVEKQALALMDHPNIAKVIDAGTTGAGRPYFVMELVKGIPITEYCDREKLTPRERIALFIPVCQAVQHAHQKGIIHRDLKPSNVLIALYDGKPVPKVIDFGVAKATGSKLTEQSMYTEIGAIVGTLEYMAPEQAELNNLDIDTRADIYSLGVILYELLTGSPPFSRKQLQGGALDQMLRMIREVEPQKPSTKLSSSHELPALAASRKLEPKRLTKLVRGELDWIVMKCLEKERARRYETANGLASELQRFLNDEPVLASPPGVGYRLRKFVRKHRGGALAAGLIAASILVGITLAMIGFANARRNERIASAATVKAQEEAERANREAARAAAEAERAVREAKDAETAKESAQSENYIANLVAADASFLVNEPARVRARLDACPEALRNWEWQYLNARADHSLTVQPGNRIGVVSAAFNEALDRIAMVDGSSARLIETSTGKELASFKGRWSSYSAIAINPAGNRVVAASWNAPVKVFDAATGEEVTLFGGHRTIVQANAFSPTGDRVASGDREGIVRIWDAQTGKELMVLSRHRYSVYSVCFDRSGNRVVTTTLGNDATVFDAKTGKELLVLRGHTAPLNSARFSHADDKIITSSADQTAKVWDAASGKLLATLRGHSDGVISAAFSSTDQQIVTASDDKTARLWHVSGRLQTVLGGNRARVVAAEFAQDGERVITVAGDGTIRTWATIPNQLVTVMLGHRGMINTAAFDGTGERIVTGGSDRMARVWDATTGKEILTLGDHLTSVVAVMFTSRSDRIVTVSQGAVVRTWDAATGALLTELVLKRPAVPATSPHDLLSLVFGNSRSFLSSAAFSAQGDRLVAVCNGALCEWEFATGKATIIPLEDDSRSLHAQFNRNGNRVVTSLWDMSIRSVDTESKKQHLKLMGHLGQVVSIAFDSSDTRMVTASSDGTARVWDANSGEELLMLHGHEGPVNSAAFNPKGDRIVTTANDKAARLWDANTGKELAVLRGHTEWVISGQFNPAGDQILTLSNDATAWLWHTRPYRERFPAIQAARAAEKVMKERLAPRIESSEDLDAIIQSVANDKSIDEMHRRSGLAIVTAERERRSSSLRAKEERKRTESDTLNEAAWRVVAKPDSSPEALAKAIDEARRASALAPEEAKITNTLGVALYRTGKFEEAIAMLKKAEEQRARSKQGAGPANWAFIAMAQFKLGRTNEAKASLTQMRKLMRNRSDATGPDNQAFLLEAASLIEGK